MGSLGGLRSEVVKAPNTERTFSQVPVWTGSGRTSLYAILTAMELPAGAQVGVPLFCCSVVFDAIVQAGLVPCFLDVNVDDCNLSAGDLSKKRGDLSAIVAVHMFGNPCDMDEIRTVAGALPVIEDCAQSIFSTYKGRPTGSLATASFFSFRCGKYISAGEGSAILSGEPELHERIGQVVSSFESWSVAGMLADSLATFAKATMYSRPWYGLVGYPIGSRLDRRLNLTAKGGFEKAKIAPTHAALIEARIARFQEKVHTQTRHAQMLLDGLAPGNYSLPTVRDDRTSNWYQFALRFHESSQRDAMAEYLFACGIDTGRYLDGIAEEARSIYGYAGGCPNAEQLSRTILLVPIHYTLGDQDIEHVIRSINEGSQRI